MDNKFRRERNSASGFYKNCEKVSVLAADIETLIRQALARQNGFDPQVRAKIYQSSRNALAKMIAKSGVVPPEVIESRNNALEDTIRKIEEEFTADLGLQPPQSMATPAPSSPATEGPSPQISLPDSFISNEPARNKNTGLRREETSTEPRFVETPSPGVLPESSTGNYSEPAVGAPYSQYQEMGTTPEAAPDIPVDNQTRYAEPTPQYARPRRQPIRYVIWMTALAIVVIVGWIAYVVTMEILNPGPAPAPAKQTLEENNGNAGGTFVTILAPDQPGSLVTAGNGTAKIIDDTSQPAIRIMSLRASGKRDTQAEPMLLELAPGVMKNIAGKKVTVEILAKSGDTGAATFSVGCKFGDLGDCGRKRFRIGLQPEVVIFSIQISDKFQEGQRAFLAINTDVTSAAAQSGKGAQIDIIYARIRMANTN